MANETKAGKYMSVALQWIGAATVFIFVLAAIDWVTDLRPFQSAAEREAACKHKLMEASGMFTGMDANPQTLIIFVKKDIWDMVDSTVRTNLVRTTVCAVSNGDLDKPVPVQVVDQASRNTLARYDGKRLLTP